MLELIHFLFSGVNEVRRILLSLSENGSPSPLNRVFGVMEDYLFGLDKMEE